MTARWWVPQVPRSQTYTPTRNREELATIEAHRCSISNPIAGYAGEMVGDRLRATARQRDSHATQENGNGNADTQGNAPEGPDFNNQLRRSAVLTFAVGAADRHDGT